MGTKEEPICLSDSEEPELSPILVSSSDEEDQMDSHGKNCNRRTHTSISSPKLKIDQKQLSLLRATVKLKRLKGADVSSKKSSATTTASATQNAPHDDIPSQSSVNGFDSAVSNGLGYDIYNVSDDEEELPSVLYPENSDQLGTKVVVKAEPDCGERSTAPVITSKVRFCVYNIMIIKLYIYIKY